jgi:hypothetical protein
LLGTKRGGEKRKRGWEQAISKKRETGKTGRQGRGEDGEKGHGSI